MNSSFVSIYDLRQQISTADPPGMIVLSFSACTVGCLPFRRGARKKHNPRAGTGNERGVGWSPRPDPTDNMIKNLYQAYLVLDAGEVAKHNNQRTRARRRRVEVPQHGPLLCQVLVIGVHLDRDHRVRRVAREGRNLNREGARRGGAQVTQSEIPLGHRLNFQHERVHVSWGRAWYVFLLLRLPGLRRLVCQTLCVSRPRYVFGTSRLPLQETLLSGPCTTLAHLDELCTPRVNYKLS